MAEEPPYPEYSKKFRRFLISGASARNPRCRARAAPAADGRLGFIRLGLASGPIELVSS